MQRNNLISITAFFHLCTLKAFSLGLLYTPQTLMVSKLCFLLSHMKILLSTCMIWELELHSLSITLVLQLFQKGSTAYSIIAMGPALSAADH